MLPTPVSSLTFTQFGASQLSWQFFPTGAALLEGGSQKVFHLSPTEAEAQTRIPLRDPQGNSQHLAPNI